MKRKKKIRDKTRMRPQWCYICGEKMVVVSESISYSTNEGKPFGEATLHCPKYNRWWGRKHDHWGSAYFTLNENGEQEW